MSGPLYVPVLPAKRHAATAYQQLSPDVQRGVAPLWNLPPLRGVPPGELVGRTRRDVGVVSRVQRSHPAWLDAPFADEAQFAAVAEVMSERSKSSVLRPVTGPDRPGFQQAATLDVARRGQAGFAVRVPLHGEWDGAHAHAVRELLDRADSTVEADLLLDLGAVRTDRPGAGKEALRALDALVPLAQWRTSALLGGGFPQVAEVELEHGPLHEPRMDWACWCEVTASARAYVPGLSYGDYGTQPTAAIARGPSSGNGGPPWGVLRYTTEGEFVLVKVLSRGADNVAVNRAAARELVELPDFRGAVASAGETWLRDCARGRGPQGTGNAEAWLRVGNVQHFAYVVRTLRT